MSWIAKAIRAVISTIYGVLADFKRFFWPVPTWLKIVRIGALLIVLVVAGRFLVATEPEEVAVVETQPPAVTLTSAASVAASQSGVFIGTVRAISEAQIQTEVAGRVTSVRVQPGDVIPAGAIIATLENDAEAAAVLQAEGAYEQAVANAAISAVSVSDAENTLQQAIDAAFNAATTLHGVVLDLRSDELDALVADPNNVYRSGSVLLRSKAQHIYTVENNFKALPERLTQLQSELAAPRTLNQGELVLDSSVGIINVVDTITSNLRDLIQDDELDTQFDAEEAAFLAALSTVESQINAQRSSLRNAQGQLDSAGQALNRAELAASTNEVSVADGQVKAALGSLRAAQAQLAKTILRSPIAGTVNDVAVNAGDFIGSFTPVAEVANNGSLEVQFFVTDRDASQLTVGQDVLVAGTATGTIVSIAPAVNAATQKTEVRAAINSTNLTNGSSVRVQPTVTEEIAAASGSIRLPITAVRFTANNGFVFIVTEENTLESRPVELGSILGSTVEILSGIDADTRVVADARGLAAGATVTVAND
jgi:membrane fusion protein (multidrug efflux system)